MGLTIALLSSCGESTGTGLSSDTAETSVEIAGISTVIPRSWSGVVLTGSTSPRVGELVGAYASSETYANFRENITILKDSYPTSASGSFPSQADYMDRAEKSSQRSYLSYQKVSDKNINFLDQSTGRISAFDAQYNEQTPKKRFVQTAKMCGTDIYLLTYALNPQSNTEEAHKLLSQTNCK